MATEITVSCAVCGEIKLWPTALSMLLYPDDTGHYVFRCPVCREMSTRPASARIVGLLRSVAVQETRIRPRPTPSTALTEDDLIAFGRAIESGETDPWAELDAGVATP